MRTLIGRRSASLAAIVLITLFVAGPGSASAPSSVTGEIVETFCWARVRNPGGPAHAACGIECAKRGIPVAIYDAQARKLYVLLPGRDKTALPPSLIAAMGRRVTVQGEIASRAGANFLTVQSWAAAR